eukprot:588737-Prymnesium_polylepis.1
MHEDDARRVAAQLQRRLHGRIAAAHDEHPLARVQWPVAPRARVELSADELRLPSEPEPPRGRARSQYERVRTVSTPAAPHLKRRASAQPRGVDPLRHYARLPSDSVRGHCGLAAGGLLARAAGLLRRARCGGSNDGRTVCGGIVCGGTACGRPRAAGRARGGWNGARSLPPRARAPAAAASARRRSRRPGSPGSCRRPS